MKDTLRLLEQRQALKETSVQLDEIRQSFY